jgi:hypothetical protein
MSNAPSLRLCRHNCKSSSVPLLIYGDRLIGPGLPIPPFVVRAGGTRFAPKFVPFKHHPSIGHHSTEIVASVTKVPLWASMAFATFSKPGAKT